MRVAIINITGGGMSGGYLKYLKNMLPRLSRHSKIDSIICAVPETIQLDKKLDGLENITFVSYKPSWFFPLINKKLHQHLREFDPEVLFLPGERPFRFRDIPIISMVQNMETFVEGFSKNPFVERFKCKLRYLLAKRALTNAGRVIVVSKFVRDVLQRKLKIPAEKMRLIYYGSRMPGSIHVQKPECIPDGWERRFIFTAGSIRPARGLEDLFRAMLCPDFSKSDIEGLVIAGAAEHGMARYHRYLKNWIQNNKLAEPVLWTGELTESEMSWCFEYCKLFVMTSRVESFGMIALEALEHGCLCLSADNACLPEIFADAADYYPPGNTEVLASMINALCLLNSEKRLKMADRSKSRAGQFSWDMCVEKTVQELESARNVSSILI